MGFNWEAGNWGDMPKILVEAFQILESTIADHNESEQRKQEKSNRRISIRNWLVYISSYSQ